MQKQLILASNSPRRRELLTLAGYKYSVVPSDADEITSGVNARELVRMNALAKAKDVATRHPESVVVGADTVVCLGGEVLGKPKDGRDAAEMLRRLSASEHSVLTGFAVINGGREESGVCETLVRFRELSEREIAAYVATKEPLDKAGAYGIQERGGLFAESVEGDFFNIIGLPISKLYPVLSQFGIFPEWVCENA